VPVVSGEGEELVALPGFWSALSEAVELFPLNRDIRTALIDIMALKKTNLMVVPQV
jgi:hypothetical protein